MIEILFTGDFAPCRSFERLVLQKGSKIFGDLCEDLSPADLAFLNLETPLCQTGAPIKKTGPNIRAHPDCVHAIADAGFDVVGLANNHIMDYGAEGLQETVSACANAGLTVCGAGRNLQEAQQVLFVEKKGVTIAIIAVAEHEFSIAEPDRPGAAPLDPIDNTMQIEYARSKADLVFVTIHGGNEYFPYPRPGLRKICRYFIDRGADGVMCHHVHVPGAYELYKQKLIVYSLGNLLFDHANPPQGWNEGYAARLVFDTATKTMLSHELIPYRQSVADGGIAKLQGVDRARILEKLREYQRVLSDETAYEQAWTEFCNKRRDSVLLQQYFPINIRGINKIGTVIDPAYLFLSTSRTRKTKLNVIRCESHLELLTKILRNENLGES
jgi:hypothetical protein